MSFKVGITINNVSYTPEAYAYERYLKKYGIEASLVKPHELGGDLDVHIYFMGLRPFWKPKGKWREIHEYQSLSTPSYAKFKNFLKKKTNRKPDGRIFLNSTVEGEMAFTDGIPRINRDMGVDDSLFLSSPSNPDYDLVYCGSIRKGLDQEIKRLSRLGLKILIVGNVDKDFIEKFRGTENVELAGPAKREELASIYQRARAGLNYCPDVYPFNIQTSTKALEYCAAGLGVVSNRYEWSIKFNKSRNAGFLWLDELKNKDVFDAALFSYVNVEDLKWDTVLDSCSFKGFICGDIVV